MAPTITRKPKSKKLKPAHFKRRNAEAHAHRLNDALIGHLQADVDIDASVADHQVLIVSGRSDGTSPRTDWLKREGYPLWTARFEVRPVRLRTHYAVFAVER